MKFRMRAGKKRYLDVWPVNFLTAEDTDVTDNTSLFLFQLACIVNMVSLFFFGGGGEQGSKVLGRKGWDSNLETVENSVDG